MNIYYWKAATGSAALISEHREDITRILSGDYPSTDLEKLRTPLAYPIYSWRINKRDRLLFTTHQGCLHVLEHIPNHDYQKSRFLRSGVLDKSMAAFEFTDTLEIDKPVFTGDHSVYVEIPLEYYNQKFIDLSHEQISAAAFPLPAVVNGGAGTGKTLVGLSRLAGQINHGQNLLYVSKTARLVENIEIQWREGFEHQDSPTLDFKTYNQLFYPAAVNLVGANNFEQWFDGLKEDRTIPLSTAKECYAECYTCSGFSLEDYQDLGLRHSLIETGAGRQAFYTKIFQRYSLVLTEQGKVDPALSAVTRRETRYELIVVDEAQNLSVLQLLELEQLAENHAIVYCIDSQQNLSTNCSVRDLLTQSFVCSRLPALTPILLQTTHRNTFNVARALETIKSMSGIIHGGVIDKKEASRVIVPADTMLGACLVMPDTAQLPDLLAARATSTEFAVVTLEEYRSEAIEKFGTPLVFTSDEVIGQEFHSVIVYKLMSDPESQQIIHCIMQKFKDAASAGSPKNLPKNKHQSTGSHVTWINKFYVACSRAIDTLVIMQTLDTRYQFMLDRFVLTEKIQPVALETNWSALIKDQQSRGNTRIVEQIQHQAEPLTAKCEVKAKNQKKQGSVGKVVQPQIYNPKLGAEFLLCCKNNDIKKMRKLLANPTLNINQQDHRGQTALFYACSCGYNMMVKTLIETGSEKLNLNQICHEGYTPLMIASEQGHLDVVKTLIIQGAERLNLNLTDKDGRSALIVACIRGYHLIVEALIELAGTNINLDLPGADGWTPLMCSIAYGKSMVVRSLIEIGGSRLDLNVAADNGAKALLIACNHDNHEIVSILIDQAGTRLDLNSTDGQGCTALIMASQMGLERMVRLLVEKGGERIDLNQVDNTGLTALACAGLANKLSIMNILLENTQVFVCAAKDLFLSNDMLDDPYIKLLTIAMTKKREEIFRLLSQSDIYLSAEARLHFVNQIQNNPKHPINRILSCKKKTDQTSLFAEAHRDLMSELNAFFAANSLELGTRQVNTPP